MFVELIVGDGLGYGPVQHPHGGVGLCQGRVATKIFKDSSQTMHNGRTSVTLLKFSKIGLKIVAVGLNLSPFCRRYKNVIHSLVALNTKEIIEL